MSEEKPDVAGVVETGAHAADAVVHAAHGDWDKAADSSLSMSESALNVATGGIFGAVESVGDTVSHALGGPDIHEAINTGLHAAGDALGDGMFDLVGSEHAQKSAQDFDDGNILGGLGEMAEGAGNTIGTAVEHGAEAVGGALEDAGSAAVNAVSGAASAVGDAASSAAHEAENVAQEVWDAI
ncbi:MAG TPA: hypothetical protein VGM10_31030 [Actinocrinis sp.]|jgi:hypothetical protein